MKKAAVAIFLASIFFGSCNLINPAEDIPAYIYIDTFQLKTDYATEGSAAHNITDAWILSGAEVIGVFELPATIPILSSGPTNLIIRPGIKLNGISNTRSFYPMYVPYTIIQDLKPAVIDTIVPETEYGDRVVFKALDDFESINTRFDTSSLSKAGYEFTTDPNEVFEGNRSMKVTLTSAANAFELVTKNSHKIPRNEAAFIELNYKSESIFFVGLIATGSNSYFKETVVGINPSNDWKKIYINLTGMVTGLPEGMDFRVFISGDLASGNSSSVILLDNFKLLHLN